MLVNDEWISTPGYSYVFMVCLGTAIPYRLLVQWTILKQSIDFDLSFVQAPVSAVQIKRYKSKLILSNYTYYLYFKWELDVCILIALTSNFKMLISLQNFEYWSLNIISDSKPSNFPLEWLRRTVRFNPSTWRLFLSLKTSRPSIVCT
jgi:hypothetical protein